MATLETRSPAQQTQKDTSTARRKPLVLGAVTAALVVPALVATLALADTSRPPTDTANVATVEDVALSAADSPATDSPTTTVPATAVAASAKSTRISFSLPKVVKVAERYKGVRYRYGGTTPAGFDCSGFTKYVYAKFGISLPHSASAQGRQNKRVSRANAKPGDLVITSGGAHVGIYVGKGKFIDAPMPGEVVHVRKIYTSNYYIVRVHHDTVNV